MSEIKHYNDPIITALPAHQTSYFRKLTLLGYFMKPFIFLKLITVFISVESCLPTSKQLNSAISILRS